jgi:hypothetical protein
MSKKPAVELTFHVSVKGDSSVGIPDSEDTVKVSLEHGMCDAELNAELESALKETLLSFYGADGSCEILTDKEYAAQIESDRKMEERLSKMEAEHEAQQD